MSVLPQVRVMGSECLQISSMLGHERLQCPFPRRMAIIGFQVPGIVRHRIKGYFRSLRMLHRIRDKSRQVILNVQSVAIYRTHQQMVAHIVGHGKVPPDISVPFEQRVDEIHRRLVNAGDDPVTGPHNLDSLIQPVAQSRQITTLDIRP